LSEKRKYRQFTPDQKVEIVLAGLRGDRPVRDVCRAYEISEALYYQWRDRLLEGGKSALASPRDKKPPEAAELAETINGLYKTELIKARGPWRTIDQVEVATAEWVDWFNHRRLYEYCGDIPPAEMEAAHYAQQPDPTTVGSSN
jgi:transposase-like protein